MFFLLPGGFGGGGGDLGLDEGLEAGPGDPAVGGLGDLGVDVAGLVVAELAGLRTHVAGVGGADLTGLDPGPELWVAVVQVQGVGHQLRCGVGGASDPRAELGGGELGDLRGAFAAELSGPLAAGPVGVSGAEPVGVAGDGPLVGDLEQVGLGFADGLGALAGVGEEVVLAHLVQRQRRGHGSIQAVATDI